MSRINKTVVYDTALEDCGVRYSPEEVRCTTLPWRNVVYDTPLESVVYDTVLVDLWCTILPPSGQNMNSLATILASH